jgi:hypothetical protein
MVFLFRAALWPCGAGRLVIDILANLFVLPLLGGAELKKK